METLKGPFNVLYFVWSSYGHVTRMVYITMVRWKGGRGVNQNRNGWNVFLRRS
ncbi:unnamed protein product [Nezara viridula]|uniref:Uncharacterized protein n=1 Tax=Nezara viridula TaxID=85310 RepID=A0A9P0MNG4_NEZVI|nr:unnamed protein product [Nezara viridula]